MRYFRGMIVLIHPPRLITLGSGGASTVSTTRGRRRSAIGRRLGSTAWRNLPRMWRCFAIWGRRSTMAVILQPASVLPIGRVLVGNLVLVIGLVATLETNHWSIMAFTCCSFGSSEGRSWRWRPSGYANPLGGIGMKLILLLGIVWPWGSQPRFRNWPYLWRRTVTTSVWSSWARTDRYAGRHGRGKPQTRVRSAIIGIWDAIGKSWLRNGRLRLRQSLWWRIWDWSVVVHVWRRRAASNRGMTVLFLVLPYLLLAGAHLPWRRSKWFALII